MIDKALEFLKTLVTLTNRQIIILLFSIVVAGLGVVIWKQNEIIKSKDEAITNNDVRYNNNIDALQNKINEQEKEKFKISDDAQKYFRERFEKLEEESRRNYREVRQIKPSK